MDNLELLEQISLAGCAIDASKTSAEKRRERKRLDLLYAEALLRMEVALNSTIVTPPEGLSREEKRAFILEQIS